MGKYTFTSLIISMLICGNAESYDDVWTEGINEGAIGIKGLRMVAGVDRSTSDSATNAEADKTLAYMGAFTLANCLSKEIEIGGALGKRQYATSIVGNDNNDPASDNHVSEIYAELPISDKIGIRFTVFNNFKPYNGTNDYDNYGWTVETKFRKPLLKVTLIKI